MDKILLSLLEQNGVAGLLLGVGLLLSFRLMVELGKFVWKLKKEKDQVSEETMKKLILAVNENTSEIKNLEGSMQKLETAIGELPKFKLDLKRLFTATRLLAGEQWPEIREEMMRDDP